ncbi:hypothetical protein STEG23_018680 [Scotinomys teguina]
MHINSLRISKCGLREHLLHSSNKTQVSDNQSEGLIIRLAELQKQVKFQTQRVSVVKEALAILFTSGFKSDIEPSPADKQGMFVISTIFLHGHTEPQFSHAKMGRRQCKSAYNIIKNKTTPESSPPPTPKYDYCNADKAEENDLKKSLMKILEEAFEEKMKNVSKEIGENTNKNWRKSIKKLKKRKAKNWRK